MQPNRFCLIVCVCGNGDTVLVNVLVLSPVSPFPCRHTAPEKFYIEACDDGANEVLAIDRVSTEMTLIGRTGETLRDKRCETNAAEFLHPTGVSNLI